MDDETEIKQMPRVMRHKEHPADQSREGAVLHRLGRGGFPEKVTFN